MGAQAVSLALMPSLPVSGHSVDRKSTPAHPASRRVGSLRRDALNLPNLLTLMRVVLIPSVLFLLSQGNPKANFWALVIYAVTAVTDFLDGWLARRQNLSSVLGKFLDPLADKLLVMAILVWLCELGRVPAWIVVLILARELSVTSLRIIAMSEGMVIAAGGGGKDKTALQMTALAMLVLHDGYLIDFGFVQTWVNFQDVGFVLLCLSLFLALTSASEYVRLFVGAVEAKEQRASDPRDAAG